MEAISIILALITVAAITVFLVSLIMFLFKRWRQKVKRIFAISFVIAIIAPFAGMKADEIAKQQANENAVALGFVDAAEQSKAKFHGYTTFVDWQNNKKRIEAEEKVALEKYQAERLQKAREELAAKADEEARKQALIDKEKVAKNERKAKLTAKTVSMANLIVKRIRSHYGKEPESNSLNNAFCREDGYCDFYISPFRVQVYGAGIAEVTPSNQAPHIDYLEACGVVFAALTNSEARFAGEAIGEAFRNASLNGSFRSDLYGLKVDVKPSSTGTLGCHFFKY